MGKCYFLFDFLGAGTSDSDPIKIDIQCVRSSLSNPILTIMVRGMASSIPTGPNTQPQKSNEIKTMRGDIPNPFPMNLGSMRFPITKLTIIKPKTLINGTIS